MRYNRRSIRLRGFDYSRPGYYFVTICVNHRRRLLGSQRGESIALSPAGEMVERVWYDLARRYVGVEVDEFVVMPDHVHGLLKLVPQDLDGFGSRSGRAPAPAPDTAISAAENNGPAGRPVPVGPDTDGWSVPQGRARGPAPATAIIDSLSDAVHRFKSFTTAEYRRGMVEAGWPPVVRRFWQRNYWESIVWDTSSLDRIRSYIRNNPSVSARGRIIDL